MRTLRLLLAGAAAAAVVAVPGTATAQDAPAQDAAAQMCRIVIDPFWFNVPGTDIWISVPRVYCVRP